MPLNKVLVTGSCGLVGSEAAKYFTNLGCEVVGVDNNQRFRWFGKGGDTSPMRTALLQQSNYLHYPLNIMERDRIDAVVWNFKPDLVVHAAAQPSHEKSAEIPWEDFNVNAQGTVNLLEAVRLYAPETIFVHVSTNKVYGDLKVQCVERETRYELPKELEKGFDESFPLDQTIHSPFGAAKAAADLMVQEYGRYYGLRTACFRCGCITGKAHKGVKQHGFLAYLCKCAINQKPYTIYGYGGKQVRDNIHALDLVRAFHAFAEAPKPGAVYNIGGGHENSCSVVEAIEIIRSKTGLVIATMTGPKRKADHQCYWTNNSLFQSEYEWKIHRSLNDIFDELLENGGA